MVGLLDVALSLSGCDAPWSFSCIGIVVVPLDNFVFYVGDQAVPAAIPTVGCHCTY